MSQLMDVNLPNMDSDSYSAKVPFLENDLASFLDHFHSCSDFKRFFSKGDAGIAVIRAIFYPIPFEEIYAIRQKYLNPVRPQKFVIDQKKIQLEQLITKFSNSTTDEEKVNTYINVCKIALEATICRNVQAEKMVEFFQICYDGIKSGSPLANDSMVTQLFQEEDVFKKQEAIKKWCEKLSYLDTRWADLVEKKNFTEQLVEIHENRYFCIQVLIKSAQILMTAHRCPMCTLL
ncbi:hypothetical protein Ciccas_010590 [Cichlidogyrus casuarinus]|uniref:Uncharacterized protein n=1 Tax=Cichlidogyrus casuarinus TaxID=1844966 RepID=A0ABD2PTT6_9PLAT